MILLLDTHVVAWAWGSDRRLGMAARDAIVNRSHRVLVSAISPWEMGVKPASGGWPEVGPILERLDFLMEDSQFESLPITSRHAIHAAVLDWPHRNPFDRILAAQARLEGARLVTADASMLAYLPDALDATKG